MSATLTQTLPGMAATAAVAGQAHFIAWPAGKNAPALALALS